MTADKYGIAKLALERAYEEAQAALAAGEQLSSRHRAALENKGPTAHEMASQISSAVKAILGDQYLFYAKQGARLSNHDAVMVTYASVPKGSPEIDALNAKTNPMWHITAAKDHFWWTDGPAPAKVTIEMFRGDIQKEQKRFDPFSAEGRKLAKENKVTFRAKTDTPDKVVKYLVDFIKKNREHFLP